MSITFSTPHEALKTVFGYDSFREGQEEVVNAILSGQDGVFVKATGGGKSLTFQIPALCREGTTIVISPLIALMKDQVERLNREGVEAGYLNSSLSAEDSFEQTTKLATGKCKLFYVAPERLANEDFINILKNIKLSYLAVDEAHTLSTWGKDFRLSYGKIKDVIKDIESHKGERIQRYACTATATDQIISEIKEDLQMVNPFEMVGSFDRPNIEFNVRESRNKVQDVVDICKQNPGEPAIVYCATIKTAESLTKELERSGVSVGLYHGKLDAAVKNRVQEQYLNDELNVMVATNAFGMGVDKPNVRHVIHYAMPGNLENYYQEAGRAGRDGEESRATLLYSQRDRRTQDFFVETSFPDVSVIEGVRMFLRAFDDGMPITFTYEEIANISPDNIKTHQMGAILRILEDQGVIKLHSFDIEESSPTIEVIDANKELDLDYLVERKKIVIDNLNVMERYCLTKRCLREFILDYFGEQMEKKNCGHCGSCYEKQLATGQTAGIIPDEAIRSVLGLGTSIDRRINENEYTDLLIGVKSRIFSARGYDKLEHYGALSNWTKSDVKRLVEHMMKSQLLYKSPRGDESVFVTPKGMELLSERKLSMMEAPEGLKSVSSRQESSDEPSVQKTNSVLDHNLYEKLEMLRNNLSQIHGKAPFMIFSDETMKLLATIKPESKEQLVQTGLSPVKINAFGDDIVTLISKFDRHIENDVMMDIPI